jgi:hypothetical protein
MFTWISLAFFTAFLLVASIDGIYYHLHRFRLWAHRESWGEHLLHTLRAELVPLMLWAFFLVQGPALGLAVALVGVDMLATWLDVRIEPKSRRRFGGLPRGEVLVHVVATMLHVGALGAGFAAKLSGEALPTSMAFSAIVVVLLLGSAAAAVQHVILAVRGVPGCCDRVASSCR